MSDCYATILDITIQVILRLTADEVSLPCNTWRNYVQHGYNVLVLLQYLCCWRISCYQRRPRNSFQPRATRCTGSFCPSRDLRPRW